MRRKINQSFSGMFIGLTVYCLLVLSLVPSGQVVISGTLALLLSVITFVLLRQSLHDAGLYEGARRIGQIKDRLHEEHRLAGPD